MFSDKTNINILTALLVEAGIRDAVVCPGSRNAAIVHNLIEAGLRPHSVLDERSAAYYALGIADATGSPVVVCVTSGTAVADTQPAISEAYYRHKPLIIISADRPEAWIGQLDGQTIPQPDILQPFTRASVSLPEPTDDTSRWYCNRLVNEALLEAFAPEPAPVQINVPITEPLFNFTVPCLPEERLVRRIDDIEAAIACLNDIIGTRRTLLVVGQTADDRRLAEVLMPFAKASMAVWEPLCALAASPTPPCALTEKPEYVIYIGDTLVSKATKAFLRDQAIKTVRIGRRLEDTFTNTTILITCPAVELFSKLQAPAGPVFPSSIPATPTDTYSAEKAVRLLEEALEEADYDFRTHYANSMAVRLGCRLAHHYIYVNRGTNGIEGSASTAAGMSIATRDMVFCITGDLSFFYDMGALRSEELGGNLRILLLNNGGGAIFHTIAGLGKSPYLDKYVAASHTTTARSLCECLNIGYLSASDDEHLAPAIERLTQSATSRPLLLEVFTKE